MHNRITVKQDGEKVIVTSNDDHVKQVFFGWASWGTGMNIREYPEFYGRPLKPCAAKPVSYSDEWQWDLTRELCDVMIGNLTRLTLDEPTEEEGKANAAVLNTLKAFLEGKLPTYDAFTEAYIAAAFGLEVCSRDNDDEIFDVPLEEMFTVLDIEAESEKTIRADCARFQAENEAALAAAYPLYGERAGYSGPALAGHDFWLTRNGCGTGFQDRDLGELGDELANAARAFREISGSVYEGKVYFE